METESKKVKIMEKTFQQYLNEKQSNMSDDTNSNVKNGVEKRKQII